MCKTNSETNTSALLYDSATIFFFFSSLDVIYDGKYCRRYCGSEFVEIYGDVDRIRFSDGIAVSVVELTIACELAFDAASIYNEPG